MLLENQNNSETEENNLKFTFIPIDDASHYANIFSKENFKTLEKWGLVQNMELIKFRFNLNLDLKDLDRFLKDFFNDKNVLSNFSQLNNIYSSLPSNKKYIDQIKFKKLSTKWINLDPFNVLYESGICTGEK